MTFMKLGRSLIRIKSCSDSTYPKMSAGDVGLPMSRVLKVLENFAPNRLAESWDNTGLLVEPYTPRLISTILLTNDLTEDVAKEANDNGCQLIISYHPPIFEPLKSVVQSSWKERIVSYLLENRIALYSPHSSWDSVQGGVNDWLASAFGAPKCTPILPGATRDVGAGRLCKLDAPVSLSKAVSQVKELTGLKHVRFALGKDMKMADLVTTVALCAGSGSSVLKEVQADLYLTGEMLHHDVLDAAQKGISVILTNHSDSERGFLKMFSVHLEQKLEREAKVIVSKCDKDPLETL